MKNDIGRWALVVFMSFLMIGCSSIRARTETADKEWTVYPGIQLDVKDTGELFSGKNSEPYWIKGGNDNHIYCRPAFLDRLRYGCDAL